MMLFGVPWVDRSSAFYNLSLISLMAYDGMNDLWNMPGLAGKLYLFLSICVFALVMLNVLLTLLLMAWEAGGELEQQEAEGRRFGFVYPNLPETLKVARVSWKPIMCTGRGI